MTFIGDSAGGIILRSVAVRVKRWIAISPHHAKSGHGGPACPPLRFEEPAPELGHDLAILSEAKACPEFIERNLQFVSITVSNFRFTARLPFARKDE
jgi:hypothetical protein